MIIIFIKGVKCFSRTERLKKVSYNSHNCDCIDPLLRPLVVHNLFRIMSLIH